MAQWFRFYDDFFHHLKTRRLKNPLFKLVVIAAWSISSRSPERGKLLIGSERLPADAEDIANEADIPVEIVVEALGTKEQPGPVTKDRLYLTWDENGVLCSPTWAERQFGNDPTNADRQRRHREGQKGKVGNNEPSSNNERNALRNVTNNASDSDSDTDLKEEDEEEYLTIHRKLEAFKSWLKANSMDKVALTITLTGSPWEKYLIAGFKVATLKLAVTEAANYGASDVPAYVYRILNQWLEAKVLTPGAARAHMELRKEEKERGGRDHKGGPGNADSQASGTGAGRAGKASTGTPNPIRGGTAQSSRKQADELNALTIK